MSFSREKVTEMFESLAQSSEKLQNRKLHEEQVDILCELLNGRNVFCQLPTGFGKSLPMFVYPLMKKVPVVIISPLTSLIEAHSIEATSMSLRVCNFAESKSITEIGPAFVYIGTPEAVVNNTEIRSKLHEIFVNFPAALIAVDEAHCIPKWGGTESISETKAQPFRDAFGKLGVLRLLATPSNPFLVLTATATAETRAKILKKLTFNLKDFYFILRHPVRRNTYFSVVQLPADQADQMESLVWIYEKAKSAITSPITDRVLVYCQTVADCGRLYQQCIIYLAKAGYNRREQWNVAAIYHSGTPKPTQKLIRDELLNENGHIAVLFASSALGMGVDVKLVSRVVIYGIPDGFEGIIQMAGRAGRGGEDSVCTIYFQSTQWSGKPYTHELRPFLKSSDCRRRGLLAAFVENEDEITRICRDEHLTRCCDACSGCQEQATSSKESQNKERLESQPKRLLCAQQLDKFRASLKLQQESMRLYDWCLLDLSDDIISKLCDQAAFIEDDADIIVEMFSLLYRETALRILASLRDCMHE